jgi:hypothetical protein
MKPCFVETDRSLDHYGLLEAAALMLLILAAAREEDSIQEKAALQGHNG